MIFKASQFTMIAGSGTGHSALNAFDNALQIAGVGNCNLIKVSSILPPLCKESINIQIPQGSLLPVAYSTMCSSNDGEEIVAAIGIGIPSDPDNIGVIMEYSAIGSSVDAEKNVKQMVEDAMNNRNIQIADILIKSCQNVVHNEYDCVLAAVALW